MRRFCFLAPLAVLTLLVGACGLPLPSDDESSSRDGEAVLESGAPEGEAASEGNSSANDPSNLWLIGWRATGPEGTELTGTITYRAESGDIDQSADRIIGEDGEYFELGSVFIDGMQLEMTVASGGPVILELIIARPADPEDPFSGGITVREVVQTAEIELDGTTTVSGTLG